ncbi:MAG: hypothetical protein HZA90_13855 [Verrucomicrobia bacterium]|nr:hypothetical protein [Verrucomicrobiota bacterium]
MKLLPSTRNEKPARVARARRLQRALTLPEMMITLAVFIVTLGGVMASHLYGLRMAQVICPKLGASDEARAAVSKLVEEVRSAKILRVGTGSLQGFAEIPVNTPQRGNSIQIYPSLETNAWVRYFWDSTDNRLKRTTNGASSTMVVANAVSNQLVFTAEDYAGRILTNNYDNRIIGLKLEFFQIQYPKTAVGPGNYYDYYQLHTRIARRSIL